MAWIESHQQLARHPKVLRLARILKVNKAQAIGHLHLLWWWTLDFSPTGDLSAFTSCELGSAAEWQGDGDCFRKALSDAGFLDADGKVHDWYDYAGKLIAQKVKDRERKRAERLSDGHPPDIQGMSDSTQPNPTVQDRTKPNPDPPPDGIVSKDPANIPKELHSPSFTAAWQRWMTFRRGMGKKPKDWAELFCEQLDWLRGWGADDATEILKQSIRNGWQGLFELKQQRGPGRKGNCL